jgi:hypothetical protein
MAFDPLHARRLVPRTPRRPGLRVLLAAVSLLGACGYRARGVSLTAADLRQPERTRITNFMSAPLRPGSPSEQPVAQVPRPALLDEVRVASVDQGELCFDLVVRSAVVLDTALSEMRILVAGQPARIAGETVDVRDYPYTGERDLLVAEHVTKDAFTGLRLTAPEARVFRVIERRGRACRTMAPPARGELSLELISVQDDNRGNWGEKFTWTIE